MEENQVEITPKTAARRLDFIAEGWNCSGNLYSELNNPAELLAQYLYLATELLLLRRGKNRNKKMKKDLYFVRDTFKRYLSEISTDEHGEANLETYESVAEAFTVIGSYFGSLEEVFPKNYLQREEKFNKFLGINYKNIINNNGA